MSVVLLVEGKTETALRAVLKRFLDERAEAQGKPRIALRTKPMMTLNQGKLRGRIRRELSEPGVAAVVGLIDVYPDFASAEAAKRFLREAADDDPRFFAHAAQYEVEAWLLPFWDAICRRLRVRQAPPGPWPEQVDLERPPSLRLGERYRRAKPPRKYIKTLEMSAILGRLGLAPAAACCPELKALLNTLLAVGDLAPLD